MKRITKRCRRTDPIALVCGYCLTEFETNNYLLDAESDNPLKNVVCECVECKSEFKYKLPLGTRLEIEERGQDSFIVLKTYVPTVELSASSIEELGAKADIGKCGSGAISSEAIKAAIDGAKVLKNNDKWPAKPKPRGRPAKK